MVGVLRVDGEDPLGVVDRALADDLDPLGRLVLGDRRRAIRRRCRDRVNPERRARPRTSPSVGRRRRPATRTASGQDVRRTKSRMDGSARVMIGKGESNRRGHSQPYANGSEPARALNLCLDNSGMRKAWHLAALRQSGVIWTLGGLRLPSRARLYRRASLCGVCGLGTKVQFQVNPSCKIVHWLVDKCS